MKHWSAIINAAAAAGIDVKLTELMPDDVARMAQAEAAQDAAA